MSVLIRGMTKPPSCAECNFQDITVKNYKILDVCKVDGCNLDCDYMHKIRCDCPLEEYDDSEVANNVK